MPDESRDEEGVRPIEDRLDEISEEIRERDTLGELTMTGDFGVHTFYDPNHSDFGIGTRTAMLHAFGETVEDLWLDADIVRDNQGAVTPETVADEAEAQLEEFIGQFRFFERFSENLEEILRQSRARYGEWPAEQRGDD